MSRARDLDAFCLQLGHQFGNLDLLEEALTHPSFSTAARQDNQRLEFLGDRVLGLCMAEALLNDAPDASEGKLAPRLNAMVRKETCADVAAEIGLGAVMRLGRSEAQSGGRRKTALLGDAMEAVIAAVYLDAGYGPARDMILRHWGTRIANAEADARDPKTMLQEWAQARGQAPPDYEVLSRKGPDHAPIFRVAVRLETGETAISDARSKRAAQQGAAEMLLSELENET